MSLQMTTIYVCIGSACHLKGSYDIINRLQALIAKQELGERVEVRAKFCMGNCGQDGVSVSVDDGPVQSLLPADTDTFFEQQVLPIFIWTVMDEKTDCKILTDKDSSYIIDTW